jgi:predicted metal-dependent hydrolase
MHKTIHEQKTLLLNTTPYTINIIRTSRRKRSIALSIPSHENITIRAPLRTTIQEIDTFLSQQTNWLIKKIIVLQNYAALKEEHKKNLDLTPYSKQQILTKFLERATFWSTQLKVEFKKLLLSNAKKRWGSCTAENVIRINAVLIKVPVELLDYVIVHELCHVRHKNHSPYFWKMVASVMPDYQTRRNQLNQLGCSLL